MSPEAAGIAITSDGPILVVANYYNDSIAIPKNSLTGWARTGELDLRPGKINAANQGAPGGEYPIWVSIVGTSTAYISSIRDREIDVVSLDSAGVAPALLKRIKVVGQPNKMTLNGS